MNFLFSGEGQGAGGPRESKSITQLFWKLQYNYELSLSRPRFFPVLNAFGNYFFFLYI
jgi:hypothetical protein